MRRAAALLLILALLAGCASYGGEAEKEGTWRELYNRGCDYMDAKNYGDAITEFKKAIELRPDRESAYRALSEAYLAAGEIDKAVETLEDGIRDTGSDTLKRLLEELKTPGDSSEPEPKPEPKPEPGPEPEPEPEPEPGPEPEPEPEPSGKLVKLDDVGRYRLNLFLSNFAEQYFGDYDGASVELSQVVMFAYFHTKINASKDFGSSGGYKTLTLEQVNARLERYFGIKIDNPPELEITGPSGEALFKYSKSVFYFPGTEVESYSRFVVADSLEELPNGLYYVRFTVWSADKYAGQRKRISEKDYYYMTPESAAAAGNVTRVCSGTATVRPYKSGNVSTWQLVRYAADE